MLPDAAKARVAAVEAVGDGPISELRQLPASAAARAPGRVPRIPMRSTDGFAHDRVDDAEALRVRGEELQLLGRPPGHGRRLARESTRSPPE